MKPKAKPGTPWPNPFAQSLRAFHERMEAKIPRLFVAFGEGQVKGLLMHAVQGRWVPKALSVAPHDAAASSLPPDWFTALGVTPAEVRTSIILPRQALSAPTLELPSTNPTEIAEMVRLQLGQLTPHAPDEVMHAHLLLDVTSEGYTRVLLLIVKREVVAQAINLCMAGGLSVGAVMTSSEAATRWVAAHLQDPAAPTERVGVLDLDTGLSEFLVVSQGRCEFTRAVPIGWARMLEDPDKWGGKLVEEILTSMDLYRHGEHEGQPQDLARLVLLGPEAMTGPLMDRLGAMKMPVQRVDPMAGFAVTLPTPLECPTSFVALLGAGETTAPPLANFAPKELTVHHALQERGRDLARLGVLLVATMTLMSCLFIEKMIIATQFLGRVTREAAAVAPAATEVEKAKMRIRVSQQRMGRETSTLRLLDRLYRAVPDDITLMGVQFEAGKDMNVKGYSANMSHIFEFASSLGRLPIFGAVKTKSVAKRRFGNQELVDFELICQLADRARTEAATAAASEKGMAKPPASAAGAPVSPPTAPASTTPRRSGAP